MSFIKTMPQHIFVGSINGVTSCTDDEDYHEIWPKFMVMIFLAGKQKFEIDGKIFTPDAGIGKKTSPIILMINVAQFSQLRFYNESNIPLKKVMISAPLPWVESVFCKKKPNMSALKEFLSGHLNHFSFAPNSRIIGAAEQIICPSNTIDGELLTLRNNALGMDIIYEACSNLIIHKKQLKGEKSLTQKDQNLAIKTRIFLLAHLNDSLTMSNIAQALGANISSLQRAFKAHYKVTIFDFMRKERLEKARILLETHGVAVSQAAYLAGYDNPASFTNAFRKEFGTAPKYHKS